MDTRPHTLTDSQQQQQQRGADDDDDNINNTTSVEPYNIIDAFIMAAMDDKIHFECVYFLLRRRPDVLKRLLSGSMTNNNNVANGTGTSTGGHNYGDGDDDDDDAVDNRTVSNNDIKTHIDCKNDDDDNRNG